jgi:hypothetical protein
VQFEDIDPSKPGGIERAFTDLNTLLENAGDVTLKMCVFDKALVVRRVTQPACDKPL